MVYPIHYKIIPTQYAFYIHKDGTLQITPVTDIKKEIKFSSVKEAKKFVENYKIQL